MKGATSGTAAYERLLEAIVRLELAPGAAVSEAQLVGGFGFSKAAVRAGLARLRAEGLVVAEPRRGHVIGPVTMRDVLEIYDLRLLLEPPGTEAAAGRIERDELARLQALAEPAVDFDQAESLRRFLAANRTIHLAIAEAAGNRRTTRILERLLDDSERARLVALRAGAGGRGVRARDELQLVLAALEKGDGPRAAQLMADAIRTFRDELVESLQHAALDVPISGLTPASA
ncbi:MAG: GntR family transcriptional regulator [Solirubrobacterales bacterium]